MFKKLSFFLYSILYLFNNLIMKIFKRSFILWFSEFIEKDSYHVKYLFNNKVKFFVPNNLVKWRFDTLLNKEPETIDWINNFRLKKFIFWDIGANIGQYSIYCAIKHKDCNVVSFEPSTNNLRILSRNISVNDLSTRIKIFPGALTNKKNKFLQLKESSFVEGSAHNNFGEFSNGHMTYTTFGTSINDIIHNNILSIPNYIKIDVDGIENLIIEGGDNVLSNNEIKEISVEINEDEKKKYENIYSLMKNNNFKLLQKRHNKNFHFKGNLKTFNFIFQKIN